MPSNGNKTSKSFEIIKYSRCHPPADGSVSSQPNTNNNWVYLERQDMRLIIERSTSTRATDSGEFGWYMKVSAFIPGELVLVGCRCL